MADNVTASAGTADGAVFASDDILGVQYPRTKITLGADGVNDGDVATGNPLPVTGTVAVTNAGLTELAGAINGSAQMDVNIAASGATVPVSGTFWQATQPVSGTFWQATQPVSLASVPSHAVTNAGTFAVQSAAAGDVAHDGVDSGNPVKTGAVAIAHGTNPTAVAAADRTNLYANRAGIPFVMGGHPNIITLEAVYIVV